jgi:hypothetical protein
MKSLDVQGFCRGYSHFGAGIGNKPAGLDGMNKNCFVKKAIFAPRR